MSAVYPTSLASYTTKVNDVDVYDASHVNRLQEEVVALQTYIGTNPHGSKTNLTQRLAVALSTNGSLAQSNGDPASPVEGQIHYRNDVDTVYVYSGATWMSLGQSLSNLVFSYALCGSGTANGAGIISNADGISAASGPGTTRMFWAVGNMAGMQAVLWSKFKKTTAVDNITVYARVAQRGADACYIKADVGGVSSTYGPLGAAWAWASLPLLDVSALGNNTYYDVIISLQGAEKATSLAAFDSVIGIAA